MEIFLFILFTFLVIKHRYYWVVNDRDKFKNLGIIFMSHRGFKKNYPENTIGAFKEAWKLQYQWIELDIISTKDSVIVCSNNFDLEKESDGIGYINELYYDDLNPLMTGVYHKNLTREKIPTLKNVINTLPKSLFINIEIKAPKIFQFKTARALGSMINQLPIERILISSFNPFVLFYFKIFHFKVRTAFLYQNLEYFWIVNWLHPTYIHPRGDLIDNDLIKYCKQKNIGINVWTVNNKPAVDWCKSKNLNGVITDGGPEIW